MAILDERLTHLEELMNSICDSPLWKAGNYDEAVLSEMGLKMEVEKYKTKTDKF